MGKQTHKYSFKTNKATAHQVDESKLWMVKKNNGFGIGSVCGCGCCRWFDLLI